MNNKIFPWIGVLVIVLVVFLLVRNSQKPAGENPVTGNNQISTAFSPTPKAEQNVPLPTQEDIIRTFFNLISEGRASEAVGVMTTKAAGDDSSKQAWGVQFNAFEKVTVEKIENSIDGEYKVTLAVQMKQGTEKVQPMPYYGWGNGRFVRFISLEKEGNLWKIAGIATGP
jgi:hypothetical protein